MLLVDREAKVAQKSAHEDGTVANGYSLRSWEAPASHCKRNDQTTATDSPNVSEAEQYGHSDDSDPLAGQDGKDALVLAGAVFLAGFVRGARAIVRNGAHFVIIIGDFNLLRCLRVCQCYEKCRRKTEQEQMLMFS